PEESDQATDQGGADDREVELGLEPVARRARADPGDHVDGAVGEERDDSGAGGKTVETVGEIDPVRRPGDDEEEQPVPRPRELATARYAAVPAPSTSKPPMIGVPCLVTWCSGPSSRIVWPYSLRRRKAMKRGPARIEISIAARPAIRTRTKLGFHRRQRFGYRLEPHRPRTFDEHGVPGA